VEAGDPAPNAGFTRFEFTSAGRGPDRRKCRRQASIGSSKHDEFLHPVASVTTNPALSKSAEKKFYPQISQISTDVFEIQ